MLKFKKTNNNAGSNRTLNVPVGLWTKCDTCGEMLFKEDVAKNRYICYKCGKYFRLNTKRRIRLVADKYSYEMWDEAIEQLNPLDFPDYLDKIEELKGKLKIDEGVTTGKCTICGEEAVVCVCDGRFLMGSMGYVVGEKITRAVEKATALHLPVIIFTCSGGARMQEGMISLMQMAKTSAALKKHAKAGLFYLSVLTDPTTGGVTASFAMLGDMILAEPGALVGFAGAKVIEQTIRQKLPEGFQRSEFLLNHGLIDGIVERGDMKEILAKLIVMHRKTGKKKFLIQPGIESGKEKAKASFQGFEATPWERVQRARDAKRPTALDYIHEIFSEFMELHGDRHFEEDGAIIGGIAYLDDCPVTVIGQQKGKTTKENITRNFGMPKPEGYRKALRLMKQAEKFGRPIICFIDTPGAFCGIEAEERGQGEAIATNLFEMSDLAVPILSIVIGEGGSGGALALGIGNEVWMMENSVYTILSPEGYASILWKDAKKAPEAASVMKVTAQDLLKMKLIEKIILEPEPADVVSIRMIGKNMQDNIRRFLLKYMKFRPEELVEARYKRFRKM
ncbi:acetyl-CoA carboxylase carboxyltransferase subunit alpha [Lachnospiraceae bacterium ZAX-1]